LDRRSGHWRARCSVGVPSRGTTSGFRRRARGAALLVALGGLAACGAAGRGASQPPASSTSPVPSVPSARPTTTTVAAPSTTLGTSKHPRAARPASPSSPQTTRTSPKPPNLGKRTTTTRTTARITPRESSRTTREPWAPSAPQPTSSQAAFALVDAWAEKNRAQAIRDAAPGAVANLFSYAYPPGGAQFRGCSTPPGNAPASCVWRVGNNLLSLTVVAKAGGWAVTAATIES
jgi:hypothetical protein